MCIGCGSSKLKFVIDFNEEDIDGINVKPPQFLKKKGSKIVKFILNYVTHKMADTIFFGGPIYTMNLDKPVVEAVAVKDGLILGYGTEEQVMTFRNGAQTKIVDLQGRTLLPGFVEPHVHLIFAYFKDWVDIGPFVNENMDQVKQKIVQGVKKAAKLKQPALFQLFDPLITPGHLDVSMKALDQISEEVPIIILQANGHIGHANSAAFKAAKIDKNTEDPEHARFMRKDGELTGQIQEPPALQPFIKLTKNLNLSQFTNNAVEIIKEATSKGLTTIHDCGIGVFHPKAEYAALDAIDKMDLPMRISGFLVSTHWDTWMEMKLQPNNYDSKLRINGIKAWADGSTQGGSAFFRDNYLKEQWGRGSPNYNQETLNDAVLKAHEKFWQVGIHCNGDAAIDMALQAYEEAQKKFHREGLRHRLEHTTFALDEHFQKMKELDIYPSFLIGHIYYYGDSFEQFLGKERAEHTDRVKAAIQHDRRPSLHCDYNCQPIDPLRCIYNAVTRVVKKTGEVLNPKECVSPMEAVRAMTIDAAFQCHMDDIVGSIENGKFADFVVLDKDPMTIDPHDIINIKVEQTWFEGELVYERIPTEKQKAAEKQKADDGQQNQE